MLFVAVGFIILFITFFVGIVNLIRELSIRSDLEESLVQEPVLNSEKAVRQVAESAVINEQDNEGIMPQVTVNSADSVNPLDEYAPFPWEVSEFDGQKPAEAFTAQEPMDSNNIEFGGMNDGLNGTVSLADLRQNREE